MKDTIVKTLLQAIEEHRGVDIVYYTASRDALSARSVLLSHLYEHNSHIYAVAYCAWRKDIRTFRTDRIFRARLRAKEVSQEDYHETFRPKAVGTGYHVLFPATCEACYAKPVRVNGRLDAYLAAGWELLPVPAILGGSPSDPDEIGGL